MKLYYHRDTRGNFGDDLNVPFFSHVCPNFEKISYEKLIGIGTLLNENLGHVQNSIIFGSGYGQGKPPAIDFTTTKILGVRGPRTARALNLDPQRYVIGDPGLYLPYVDELNHGNPLGKDCIVVALHHRTAELWSFPKQQVNGVLFLDPGSVSVSDYIATIKSARYVFAEAMHGAIVAAAYKVPFVRTKLLGKADSEKWMDLFESLHLNADPHFQVELSLPNRPFARRVIVKIATSFQSRLVFDTISAPKVSQTILSKMVETVKSEIATIDFSIVENDILNTLSKKTELAIMQMQKMAEHKG